MKAERWQQVEEVVQSALEREPAHWPEFLEQACASDPALRREVESLLRYQQEAERFIETPAFRRLAPELLASETEEPAAGRQIGSYRIVREIGRGGMGVVYLAARADDQYRKYVAIKLVQRGLDTEEMRRRFRHERQILASLEHPNIARLLDGGTTEDGLPYLVMEYVEGIPITDYCDLHRLTTNHRLQLFRTVCAAVQHAHQHLVVHRDLKPSNILITADGTPKLLDFGIAKVLSPELSALAMEHTVTELRVLTPDYASPEQVRGEKLTTTSDIYSLGVVLYELLTGHRPYRATTVPPHELARVICEREPTKPSTAVQNVEVVTHGHSESQSTITPESVSRARDTEPEKLRRRLSGDLDNIVLKAMRKEPQRRYESAAQLAADIERHLEGLPVIARKDTFAYRSTKFIKRHKVGVAAAALIILTLIGGIIATTWQARVAREQARVAAEQRDRAQRESAKAERINSFLQSIISYADPSWYAAGRDRGGDIRFIEVVNGIAARIDREFADQPEIRGELHHTVGNTYRALERFELAVPHFRAALDASRTAYGAEHPKVARDLYYLAAGLKFNNDDALVESLYREAIRMMRATDPGNANLPYMLQDFGGMLVDKGDMESGERVLREALEMSRRRYGEGHPAIAVSLDRFGWMYAIRGDLDSAEAMFREAVEDHRRSSNRQLLAGALQNLSVIQIRKGDYAGGESSLLEALDLVRASLGDAHPGTVGIRHHLVTLYEAWNKPDRAAQFRQPRGD